MIVRPAKTLPSPLSQSPLLHAVLIVAVCLLSYANSFGVPFVLDDLGSMLELPYVRHLNYLGDWSLAREYAAEHSFRTRFVGYLSFGLNYALHGASVAGYHVVNLAIHAVCALLTYILVRLTPGGRGGADTPFGIPAVALFAALLFAAHPVQTQAVTYVVQRLASLATLFCIGTLVCYALARRCYEQEGRSRATLPWYLASLACAVLAMKTKEIAFTLPLAVSVYELIFFRGDRKLRLRFLAPLFLTMLIIPLSLILVPGLEPRTGELAEITRVDSELTRYQYFATQMRVIVTYIRLLLFPVGQNVIYDYPVYGSLFDLRVFPAFLFLLSLLGFGVYLAWRYSASRLPVSEVAKGCEGEPLFELRLIAFGVLWFFLTLSVESSFIPIVDVIFEHRLYLPSVGALLAFAASWSLATRKAAAGLRRGLPYAAGAVVIVLAATTFARNEVWGSEESLWRDVVEKSPNKAHGHQLLGMALFRKGEVEQALASLDRSLAIDPDFVEALCNRGNLHAQFGRFGQALIDYRRAVEVDPGSVEAWSNMGLVFSQVGDQQQAEACLEKALQFDPKYLKALNNMGLVLTRKGDPARALVYLDQALTLNAKYELAYFNRGVALKELGRLQESVSDLTRVVELNPRQAAAYTQRGDAWSKLGESGRALADFKAGCEGGDPNGCRMYQGGK